MDVCCRKQQEHAERCEERASVCPGHQADAGGGGELRREDGAQWEISDRDVVITFAVADLVSCM